MLFNSYEFIFVYLPLTFAVYFLLARYRLTRGATAWLVIASLGFYGYWDVRYVPLLLASICFNFLIGRWIERIQSKKAVLTLGIVVNVCLLGYFKYMGFFVETFDFVFGAGYSIPQIVLPLGISFFTFTQTAYLIDAYRGETKHYSFVTYCLFVTIFPHLIAGPIINHKVMIPQFSRLRNFVINYQNIAAGLALFSMGLFKKVVIADKLSPWVNEFFAQAGALTFVEAWAAALGYTFQLYFDFSAYSEMAIGLGLLFNLRFPQNFDSPYQSLSIIDFWRRWHMTLGSWVKYYLYIPLGGNRHGEWRKMRNLFVSMAIIGLWHGAGWTFVIWGCMHGVLLMINHQWRRLHISLPKIICWGLTFVCVVIAWVFFRAATVNEALVILAAMTDIYQIVLPENGSFIKYMAWAQPFGVTFATWHHMEPLNRILWQLLGLGVLLAVMPNPIRLLPRFKANWGWFVLTLTLLLVALYKMDTYTEFLYFQF